MGEVIRFPDFSSLTAENVNDLSWYEPLLKISDPTEALRYKSGLKKRATEIRKITAVKEMLLEIDKIERDMARTHTANQTGAARGLVELTYGANGKPLSSIENFSKILNEDMHLKSFNIKFNEQLQSPERTLDTGEVIRWRDTDDSYVKRYIESTYNIHNAEKLIDALRIYFDQHQYNPVKNAIEAVAWDGIPRIHLLFNKWLHCGDTPYTREVSRLLFAGGIHRLYNPGCKFDDMIVLIGKQGAGKSSFVRWLSVLEYPYFKEVNEIEGQRGIEAIEGGWICEVSELLALTKAREVEAVKSYISSQCDSYRRPYDTRVSDHPRRCIFIGTTNRPQFLTDKTGNRRFYPIHVNLDGYDLFDHEQEIKYDILQCWAEALSLYKQNLLSPVADRAIIADIRRAQEDATEDDYMIGIIEEYLSNKYETCVYDVWENALGNKFDRPTKRDSNDIAAIIRTFPEWVQTDGSVSFGKYGKQRGWRKGGKNTPFDELVPS